MPPQSHSRFTRLRHRANGPAWLKDHNPSQSGSFSARVQAVPEVASPRKRLGRTLPRTTWPLTRPPLKLRIRTQTSDPVAIWTKVPQSHSRPTRASGSALKDALVCHRVFHCQVEKSCCGPTAMGVLSALSTTCSGRYVVTIPASHPAPRGSRSHVAEWLCPRRLRRPDKSGSSCEGEAQIVISRRAISTDLLAAEPGEWLRW